MSNPIISTEIFGANFHPELLWKSSIDAALADMRANPYLLDYIFMFYVADDLTSATYGERARQNAKRWFLSQEIFTSMGYRLDLPKYPLISITPKQSTMDYDTLGDTNYDTNDSVAASNVNIQSQVSLGPFTPVSYSSITGLITIPSNLTTLNTVYQGMVLQDTQHNIGYPVLAVNSPTTFTIASGLTNANFTNAIVAPVNNFLKVSVESILFKETCMIDCFAQNSADELYFLESILYFILFRYYETLFEARGLERLNVSAGPPLLQKDIGPQERIWVKSFTVTGYVRKYWPKTFSPTIQGLTLDKLRISGPPQTSLVIEPQVAGQNWGMVGDNF